MKTKTTTNDLLQQYSQLTSCANSSVYYEDSSHDNSPGTHPNYHNNSHENYPGHNDTIKSK